MARPINYLFCQYELEVEDEVQSSSAQFNMIAENQGGHFVHGREKDGVQPQTLCTDPIKHSVDDTECHSFEIGYRPGIRILQEYNEAERRKISRIERDSHTKFGHVVTIPSLGAMAIRDRTSDDTIGATQTISALKSLVRGIADGQGQINLTHASEDDVSYALEHWNVHEYAFTARPLNPTGGDLAKMRSQMYEDENIYQENGKVKAAPGESLKVANGTLGQTMDLYKGGYAQVGFRGQTEDGHAANLPKQAFYQDKAKNLKVRESRPRFLRISFEREDANDDKTLDVAQALMRFYSR